MSRREARRNGRGRSRAQILVGAVAVVAMMGAAAQTAGAQSPPPVDPGSASGLPTSPGQSGSQDDTAALEQTEQLRAAVDSGGKVSIHDETGRVSFLGTPAGDPIPRDGKLAPSASPEAAARGFLSRYGAAFGADGSSDLVVTDLVDAPDGRVTVRMAQQLDGVPVLAGSISVQLDAQRNVLASAGELLPGIKISTDPTLPAASAATAAAATAARAHGTDASGVVVSDPTLAVYDAALLGGPGVRGARLVWQVDATGTGAEGPFRELVLVDADSGAVALHFDEMAHGLDRRNCDDNNVRTTAPNCATSGPVIRYEGWPATGITDADAAYEFAGDTYDFFFGRFGRDSLDDAGMTLYSETRFCYTNTQTSCPYPNAFWNGQQMTYGAGYSLADDIVGHELSHGVTEFTSGLFYYYQSGAINESISDVFGELVDLTNGAGNDSAGVRWLLGEDCPCGVIRDMEDPTTYSDPDRMTSPYYVATGTDNGGVHSNSGVNNKAATLMVDGGTFNGEVISPLGIDKAAAVYYEVETALLQSGSDYGDLYDMLPQACTNLIGGSEGITAADCVEVGQAADATEMNLEPPAIANPDAPLCPAGDTKADLRTDSIPQGAPGWAVSTTAGQGWGYFTGYAHSDPYSLYDNGDAVVTDNSIRWTSPVSVPAGVSTYLVFNHAHEFEASWDGGVVEYSTSGSGGPWLDAGTLSDHSGYNGTIGSGYGNPLSGRPGFVAASAGYRQSRINLTPLAGSNVLIRFRTGTDSSGSSLGWLVDDLSVFTCTPNQGQSTPAADFDGDGDSDVVVYRPSGSGWFVQGGLSTSWGSGSDIPVSGDFNGDGTADVAVFRPSDQTWYVQPSASFPGGLATQWGVTGDVPVPADFNGDGVTDIAVFRPSDQTWYVQPSASFPGGLATQWGITGDVPVPADFNGDGADEVAVYRPSDQTWYSQGGLATQWGVTGDIPVPVDFDGNGADEVAVYRPSDQTWYSQGSALATQWGVTGDMAVPGDYDGDGSDEVAVFRPSNQTWYVQGGLSTQWGATGDIPVIVPYAIRKLY